MLQISPLHKSVAYQEILQEGREKGREEGREEGREKGRQEGRVLGELIGQILALQKVFKQPQSPRKDLRKLTQSELEARLRDLEALLT